MVLIFPTVFALTGGLMLQWWLGYQFSVVVWVGYIALFGIAVKTGVVMIVYLPKLMTVCAVLASLIPILLETGIGSGVMEPIVAPIVGGMITSTIHVLILVPVFFVIMAERRGI